MSTIGLSATSLERTVREPSSSFSKNDALFSSSTLSVFRI